ncbi:MAG: hypothetical protein SAJ12_08445 [Jaaginema sp. PMC 1079.18]|nr:hypothetical protein [Jaaginema sp. PMC 1080.18]MEC4851027.1 hypothetical protein [Jaaginema sp. PMC 1079.18]MEC4868016.1 hypothetical protein [Jaaginema sp. PMC 1078.18]
MNKKLWSLLCLLALLVPLTACDGGGDDDTVEEAPTEEVPESPAE